MSGQLEGKVALVTGAGAGIGAYMDAQERKLREQTAGTGVDVIRDGDNLLLRMPSVAGSVGSRRRPTNNCHRASPSATTVRTGRCARRSRT